MGNLLSIPIRRPRPSHMDSTMCRSTGKPIEDTTKKRGMNEFEAVTNAFFAELLDQRKDILAAKMKIRDVNMTTLSDKYPLWSYEDIMDLKAQFQTFDVNQDGLIDFVELCCVLDDIGDDSDDETRTRLFAEMDEDGSGGIDFDEYLTLIHMVTHGVSSARPQTNQALQMLSQEGTENAQRVRRLSISQQINHGLF